MNSVSGDVIKGFQRSTFIRFHIAALTGFFLGLKVCDLAFYDEKTYRIMRDDMEDEFWAKYGNKLFIYSLSAYSSTSLFKGNLRY